MGFRDLTGGFDLRKVVGRGSATQVSGWLQKSDSDQFASFSMYVSTAKRPKILSLTLAAIPRPAAFPIARLTENQVVSGVGALLRKRASADQFSGAALVAKDGKHIRGHTGWPIATRKIENTVDPVSPRLDEQDVHGDRVLQLAKRGSCTRRPARQAPARLSQQGRGVEGDATSPAHAHGRHRRYFGPEYDRTG